MSKIRMGLYELMRLKNIYLLCKDNIADLKAVSILQEDKNGNTSYAVKNFLKAMKAMNNLGEIEFLQNNIRDFYDSIPTYFTSRDTYSVNNAVGPQMIQELSRLVISVDSIVQMYESMCDNTNVIGFDVKMPQSDEFKDFKKDIDMLEFVISNCPYLKEKDEEIKFNNVDVGSIWFEFMVVTSGTYVILNNLAALVDKAIAIKSHMISIKQQEEIYRSMNIKNEVNQEILNVYKEMKNRVLDEKVAELEEDLHKLDNGEERDKTKICLEKMSLLLDKGMQVYSTIDAPKEVQILFPSTEQQKLFSDYKKKKIEKKETNEDKD